MKGAKWNGKETFVRLGRRVPGIFYEPADGKERKHTAVLVMHSDEDYLTFPTGAELAKRGYPTLCANVMTKEGVIFMQHEKMHCVKDALVWLREQPGIEKVVLMGHSGGATLMSAYQCLAENGSEIFQGSEKIYPSPDREEMVPADGIMLLDANWGNAVMQLFSLDAAVTDEESGMKLNAEMDLFNPANGFRREGSCYSEEFIRRYQKGQGARNNALLKAALERLAKIEAGEGRYSDDEPFVIPGAAQSFFNNKLFAQDIRLMSHTAEPQKLIHKDGSITTEIVHSVRRSENPESFTHSFREGARDLTVKSYLSSYAIRTEEDFGYDECHVWGIDWSSSYAAPPGNMANVKAPTLVMGMTGGWEYLAAETIYNMSAAKDKTLAFVEGASHKFTPAKAYESYPGQFGDTMKLLHDYVAGWLGAVGRF